MAISYFLNSTRNLAAPLTLKAAASWTNVSIIVPVYPIDVAATNQNYWAIVES